MMNMKKLVGTTFGFLGGIGYLFAAIAIFAWDIEKLRQVRDSRDWPQIDGRVTLSNVDRGQGESSPHVVYTYTVAGTLYTSSQISFDIFDKPGGQGRIESIIARYPVGKQVTVYYKPNEAGISILEPGDYSPFLMPLLFGVILVVGGSLTLWKSFRRVVLDEKPDLHMAMTTKRRIVNTAAMSALIYAMILLVSFDSAVRETFVLAFGERPAGMSNLVFMLALQTLLYLPMPWVFWHGMHLTYQAMQEGRRIGIWYILTVGRYDPHLRRSQLACIAGLVYFVVICVAWIVYAEALGI
jgi:hypothetical protein